MATEKGVRSDIKKCILFEDLAQDRSEWRKMIYVTDPIIVGAQGGIDDSDVIFGSFYVK